MYSNDPCGRNDNCSQCIRASAALRNLERYGSPDYPGREAAAAIVEHRRAADEAGLRIKVKHHVSPQREF